MGTTTRAIFTLLALKENGVQRKLEGQFILERKVVHRGSKDMDVLVISISSCMEEAGVLGGMLSQHREPP